MQMAAEDSCACADDEVEFVNELTRQQIGLAGVTAKNWMSLPVFRPGRTHKRPARLAHFEV